MGEDKKALVGAGENKNPVGTKYINNIFYGPIENVSIPSENIAKVEPKLEKHNGIYELQNENIGAKDLKILDENMVGPSYNIKK